MLSDLAGYVNRSALEKAVRENWEAFAEQCWEGYQEKGRGYFSINQQENNTGYWARWLIEDESLGERLREEKGVDVERLAKQMREYDPEREIVVLFTPSIGKARRCAIVENPDHMEALLNMDAEDRPISIVFSHDPPPASFGEPPAEEKPEDDFPSAEEMQKGLAMLEGFFEALAGRKSEDQLSKDEEASD